jgi:hypothetical protein
MELQSSGFLYRKIPAWVWTEVQVSGLSAILTFTGVGWPAPAHTKILHESAVKCQLAVVRSSDLVAWGLSVIVAFLLCHHPIPRARPSPLPCINEIDWRAAFSSEDETSLGGYDEWHGPLRTEPALHNCKGGCSSLRERMGRSGGPRQSAARGYGMPSKTRAR